MQKEFQNRTFFNKLFDSIKKTYTRFFKIRGNPREIALGFALGIFVGMSPYMGMHMVISVFFAALFKWNKISAAIGAWISNPATAPFIYSITYFIGSKVVKAKSGVDLLDEDMGIKTLLELITHTPKFFMILTIGGAILGIPVAIISYFIAYNAIVTYRENIKVKIAKQKEKLRIRKSNRRAKRKKKQMQAY